MKTEEIIDGGIDIQKEIEEIEALTLGMMLDPYSEEEVTYNPFILDGTEESREEKDMRIVKEFDVYEIERSIHELSQEAQDALLDIHPSYISYLKKPSIKSQLRVIREAACYIRSIKRPSELALLAAVRKDYDIIHILPKTQRTPLVLEIAERARQQDAAASKARVDSLFEIA